MPVLLPFRAYTYSPAAPLQELVYVPGEEQPLPVRRDLLVASAEPALFVYRQRFRFPGEHTEMQRTGVMGLLDREAAGPIYLHEETQPARALACAEDIRAGVTDPGSLWFWTNDPDGALGRALQVRGAPDFEATDRLRTLHEIWRVTDAQTIAAIQRALEGKELFLTDGHHRYEAGWPLATIQIRTDALRTLSCDCTVDEIEAASRQGILLPPKSTNFWPKLAAGLVMYRHQNENAMPPVAQRPGVR